MFCRNCGKPTPDGQMICNECLAAQNPQPQQEEPFAELNSVREQPTPTQPYQPYGQPQQPYGQPYQPYGQPQQPYYPAYPQTMYQQPLQGNRMEGFGKALTATILSTIGFIFAYIALIMLAVVTEYSYDYYEIVEAAGPALILAMMSIGLGIPGIILGKGGINVFKAAKSANRARPIATLILGIAGLVMGITTVSLGGLSALLGLILIGL